MNGNEEAGKTAEQIEAEQLRDDVKRGQEARDILENETLKQWLKSSQDILFESLDTIPLNDYAARQRACDLIYVFRKFEAMMREYVLNGEISKKRFDELIGQKRPNLLSNIFGQ